MSVALSTVHPFPAATGPHPPVVVTVTLTVPGGPLVADVARRLADRVRTLATEASAAVDLHARVETTVTAVLDPPPSTVAAGLRPEAPPRLAAAPELALLPDRRIALLDGGPLALTRREYDLLLFLVENASRAYTRAQLLRQVWGYDYLDGTRTVDVHVRRLRAKLHGRGPKITTVRGTGYRLDRVQLAAVIGD